MFCYRATRSRTIVLIALQPRRHLCVHVTLVLLGVDGDQDLRPPGWWWWRWLWGGKGTSHSHSQENVPLAFHVNITLQPQTSGCCKLFCVRAVSGVFGIWSSGQACRLSRTQHNSPDDSSLLLPCGRKAAAKTKGGVVQVGKIKKQQQQQRIN